MSTNNWTGGTPDEIDAAYRQLLACSGKRHLCHNIDVAMDQVMKLVDRNIICLAEVVLTYIEERGPDHKEGDCCRMYLHFLFAYFNIPELIDRLSSGLAIMAVWFNSVEVFDKFLSALKSRPFLCDDTARRRIIATARAAQRPVFLEKMSAAASPFDFPPQQQAESNDDDDATLKAAALDATMERVQQLVRDHKVAEASELFRRVPTSLQRTALNNTLPPQAADVLYVLCGVSNVIDPLRLVRSIRCMEYVTRCGIDDVFCQCSCGLTLFEPFLRGTFLSGQPQLAFKHPAWQSSPDEPACPLPTCVVPVDDFERRYMRMFVPLDQRPAAGTPLTVTRREFLLNLEAFSGVPDLCELLAKHSMVVAGGAVVACLSAPLAAEATLSERREYFAREYANSDLDIFPVSGALDGKDRDDFLTEEEKKMKYSARNRLYAERCPNSVRMKSLVEAVTACDKERGALVLATSAVITIVRPYPHRRVQMHGNVWTDTAQVILNSDVDCCGVAFDGTDVWFTHRALFSWTRRINIPNAEALWGIRGSPTYEKRLHKYATRNGFAVLDIGVPVDRVASFVDSRVPSDAKDAKEEMLGSSGCLWLRLVERHPAILRRERAVADGADYPWHPDVTFESIARHVLRAGYVPSDNYGT
eukprot:PhM_4_TR2102/c3_g6_i12/m.6424